MTNCSSMPGCHEAAYRAAATHSGGGWRSYQDVFAFIPGHKTCARGDTQSVRQVLCAQARIALVNTALTAAGMWALAIPGIGLLSLFVFICSFIPIAGCFISTVPIAFVALTEYGFLKARARVGSRPCCMRSFPLLFCSLEVL